MKTVFFDVETTGIDPDTAAVVQIGAILDVDGVEVDRVDIKMIPHSGAMIDPKAMAVTGLSMEDLMENPERVSPRAGYWMFMKLCGFKPGQRVYQSDRVHLAGFNSIGFDNRFLQALGRRAGDGYTYAKYHWPGIDVASLACVVLRHRRLSMPNFKLMTVAEELGISTDGKAHDALFDVHVTREVYYDVLDEKHYRGL